mmetsp:Transcript_2442/g.3437  ORF Transcript_2442/g.3437 Transcript_2442/m.3437 type:complete len:90 (+) Transcript_2442:2393-2662(+)
MKELLGQVLGPSKNEGKEMAQNVLSHKGIIAPRRSVKKLTNREWAMESKKVKRADFDKRIKAKLGDSIFISKDSEEKIEADTNDHTFDS